MTVDDLKKLYGVNDDQDLAEIFGLKDRSTIAKWRTRLDGRVPAHIERKAQETFFPGIPVPLSIRTVPVISKVEGGDYGYWEDSYPVGEGSMRIECPPDISDSHAFAVQVTGDSMYPRFIEGEYVIVDTTKPVCNGDDVVVMLHDGAVMIKRYRLMRDMVFLESWNPAYEAIPVLDGDMKRCYKVVDHRPKR